MSDLITKLHTMCNMFEMGHTIRSTALVRQAADLIEQQQARIAELEAKTSCCMGVGNGNGRLFVYGDHESIKTMQRYILERDEMVATVERLRDVAVNYHDENIAAEEAANELWDIHKATPRQNLNAVKRSAYQKGFCDGACYASQVDCPDELTVMGAEQGAAQRYPDKE